MKYLHKNNDLCIGCLQCEEVCAEKVFKLKVESSPAIVINKLENEKYSINVCDQCGECIPVCSEMAINRNDAGVVLIDKKRCVGCLICVGFCSKGSMRYSNDRMEPYKCIACGLCVSVCPTGAIEIRNE